MASRHGVSPGRRSQPESKARKAKYSGERTYRSPPANVADCSIAQAAYQAADKGAGEQPEDPYRYRPHSCFLSLALPGLGLLLAAL
jgi:hypothetical protein